MQKYHFKVIRTRIDYTFFIFLHFLSNTYNLHFINTESVFRLAAAITSESSEAR